MSSNETKDVTIVIANKRYSSWSMRPWLALRYAAKHGFNEILCNLNQEQLAECLTYPHPETQKVQIMHPFFELVTFSPTKKVPVLIDNRFGETIYVWESIAIMLYIADTFPDAHLLPVHVADRALCLSVISEMHSGFMGLRTNLAVHTVGKGRRHGQEALGKEEVQNDIRRIAEMWTDLRRHSLAKDAGPYLFGSFTLADAMYAPVTFRFTAYDDENLSSLAAYPLAQQYIRDLQSCEIVQEWVTTAKLEPEESFLQHYEKFMD
jgi:glutathione S-transferase